MLFTSKLCSSNEDKGTEEDKKELLWHQVSETESVQEVTLHHLMLSGLGILTQGLLFDAFHLTYVGLV